MLPNVPSSILNQKRGLRGLTGKIPASASPAVASGLAQLRDILVEENISVNSYDELYSVAISVLKLVAAKEKRQMDKKSNKEIKR